MFQRHKKIVDTIFNAPIDNEPFGWKLIKAIAVGGLNAVGFEYETDDLLIVSTNGQSVIDTDTGEKVYRNHEADGYDVGKLEAFRLDIDGKTPVKMMGLEGGGLPNCTNDGWRMQIVYKNWPNARLVLLPPKSYLYNHLGEDCLGSKVLAEHPEFRVWGFSYTGKIMIWSNEVDIRIFKKI